MIIGTKMKTAIYIRVSKGDQNPETQNVLLKQYCRNNDFDVYDIYLDYFTGKSDSRPAFDRLMTDMRDKRFNTIVVYKLDRIGRSLQHLLQLFQEFKNRNIDFISITQNINTTTPEGKLMLRVLMIMSEYERELIVSRTKDTLNRYQKDIEEKGFFVDREGKEHKKLGRPKGSKDKNPERPKAGYYRRWERVKQSTPRKLTDSGG